MPMLNCIKDINEITAITIFDEAKFGAKKSKSSKTGFNIGKDKVIWLTKDGEELTEDDLEGTFERDGELFICPSIEVTVKSGETYRFKCKSFDHANNVAIYLQGLNRNLISITDIVEYFDPENLEQNLANQEAEVPRNIIVRLFNWITAKIFLK